MWAPLFLGIYLALMIGIGIWGMRKTTNVQDFFLGGRSVGPFVSALAFGTSYFSAVVFIGFAGKLGWGFGLNVLWIALGNAIAGSCLAWLVLGHRTRVMSHNLESMTMPEFFDARYNAPRIRIFAALIIFVFLLPYSASVYKGLGHLFEANFDVSYSTALIIMAVITGIYLMLGGYFAVTLTDFIQGLIMLVGSVAMVAILVGKGGGLSAVLNTIQQNYPAHVPPAKQPDGWLLGSLVFMTSFGTWGLPQMIQKFYAIKSEKVIRTAAIVTTLFALVVVTAAYFNGAMSHVFYDAMPEGGPDVLIPEMLKKFLPEALMALILLLLLSASMSTLSSLVLVSSSAIAIDIYQKHHLSDEHNARTLRLMRILSGIFVALSLVLALNKFDIIVNLMSLSWGVVAGSFMAPYLYSLFWKGTTRAGVWAGILTGLSISLALFSCTKEPLKEYLQDSLPSLITLPIPIAATIAMLVPFVVVPVVSLYTKGPSAEQIEKAFANI